jgi:riboflavin-specific deaminase-like protein
MEFRQLLPEPATVDEAELLGALDLPALAPAERPYTLVNFVSSVDGRATIGGRSGQLGDEGDSAMFHCLREQVDAVLVGTGTVRAERYGRILGKAERRERRLRRGLSEEPLAALITRTGDVPLDAPLFSEPEARVLIFAPAELDLANVAAQVQLVAIDPGELTLTTVARHLREDHGVRSVLCEGGPTLFGALLQEGLVDELFLTIAPKLAGGGSGLPITVGSELPDPAELKIHWLLERRGSLYARYAVR